MNVNAPPRPFPEWRTDPFDREEDAAYAFGYHLIIHCRDEAIATLPPDAPPEMKQAVEKAVDIALHNLNDLLEGFWPLDAGPAGHRIELALGVRVRDAQWNVVETHEISPAKLGLPIGYWKWARDRKFR
jgi:hypothetical protein